jgi:hypothetical protein
MPGSSLSARCVLTLAARFGLAGGLIDAGIIFARVICRAIDPSQRVYLVSRHFLGLGPLSNLLSCAPRS